MLILRQCEAPIHLFVSTENNGRIVLCRQVSQLQEVLTSISNYVFQGGVISSDQEDTGNVLLPSDHVSFFGIIKGNKFSFFTRLVSESFREKSQRSCIHYDMLACIH